MCLVAAIHLLAPYIAALAVIYVIYRVNAKEDPKE